MSIRILLADDEPLVRTGLSMILSAEADLEVVAAVGDGQQAVAIAASSEIDVAVLDVRMPVLDGVEATRRITASSSRTKVLILTTFKADEAVLAALRAGASGFLLKDAVPANLIDAVRAVYGGEGWLAPAVTRVLINEFAARPAEVDALAVKAVATLTPRERDVLICIAAGMSNREAARVLFLGEGTVKSHVSHILAKLGLRDRSQAVSVAYRAGVAGDPTSTSRTAGM